MLGVKTEKGRAAEENVRKAVLRLQRPPFIFAWYPRDNYFPVDGFIVKGNDITALFECKIREAELEGHTIQFKNKHYDSLILSEDKILNGAAMAKQMRLDFYLIAYFSLNDAFLIFKLYDAANDSTMQYEAKKTWTQENVNGGEAFRSNAFLKVDKGKRIFGEKTR